MVLILISPQYCAEVAFLKNLLWSRHTNGKLCPTWQEHGNPEVGCGEVDKLELQQHNVLDSALCFIGAPGDLVGAGEVGIRSNGGVVHTTSHTINGSFLLGALAVPGGGANLFGRQFLV